MTTEDGAMATEARVPGDEVALDGNAVAGLLMAAFGLEMTAVPGRCAHCHTVNMVGSMRAWTRAPGTVLRCPVCGEVVLRIVETPTSMYLDLRGVELLRLERA